MFTNEQINDLIDQGQSAIDEIEPILKAQSPHIILAVSSYFLMHALAWVFGETSETEEEFDKRCDQLTHIMKVSAKQIMAGAPITGREDVH